MRILLIDDHALVRAGLRRLLASLAQEIVEARDGREALTKVRQGPFDLVVLDLNLPGLGGLELLSRLRRAGAGPILVLTMHAEPLYARRALDVGADGYMTKNATPDELVEAVRKVAAGGRHVQPDLAQVLAAGATNARGGLETLSRRELEIMRLLARGASLSEIAAAVGVGYKTVANNCSQIKTKLGVTRTADLVRLAIETGLS